MKTFEQILKKKNSKQNRLDSPSFFKALVHHDKLLRHIRKSREDVFRIFRERWVRRTRPVVLLGCGVVMPRVEQNRSHSSLVGKKSEGSRLKK